VEERKVRRLAIDSVTLELCLNGCSYWDMYGKIAVSSIE
jgi:hypothetical protein